jgi:hypothetical protein
MELINQYTGELITLLVGGGVAWFWQRVKTRKERKSDDFTFLSDGFTKMQEGIRSLTEQNNELMQRLVDLQDKHVAIMQENISLKGEVELLKKLHRLARRGRKTGSGGPPLPPLLWRGDGGEVSRYQSSIPDGGETRAVRLYNITTFAVRLPSFTT